jgi:hypothetical protein
MFDLTIFEMSNKNFRNLFFTNLFMNVLSIFSLVFWHLNFGSSKEIYYIFVSYDFIFYFGYVPCSYV